MGRMSYLLDSNILSEPARLKSDDKVLQQLADHDGDYTTAARLYGMSWCMVASYWQRLNAKNNYRPI